jgi:hypothetical protein
MARYERVGELAPYDILLSTEYRGRMLAVIAKRTGS